MGAEVAAVYGESHVARMERSAIRDSVISGRTCPGFRFAPSGLRGCSHPRHHYVFDLDIFFHAVMRTFASQAALLHAAERRHFRRDQASVDADHAGLQGFGDAPDTAEIARIEVRR